MYVWLGVILGSGIFDLRSYMIQKSTVLLYVPEMMEMPAGRTTDSAWRREPIGMTAETQEKENSASERAGFLTQ